MKKSVLIGMVLTAVLLYAMSADAMRVNNNSKKTIHVEFECGFFCGNSWDIPAGDWKARPGEDGRADIISGGKSDKVYVTGHGMIDVTCGNQDCACLRIVSYDDGGSVRETGSTCY